MAGLHGQFDEFPGGFECVKTDSIELFRWIHVTY